MASSPNATPVPMRPRTDPAALAGWMLLTVFALFLVALVLRPLGTAWPYLVAGWQDGPTLRGLTEQVFVRWPQSWNWAPALAWLRPTDAAIAPLTAFVGWVVVIFGFMLPMVTYLIYALRKIIGFMQARVGPTQVGPLGLLQTPCDVLKLLTKEDVIPRHADKWVFIIAPFIVLVPATMAYLVVPFGNAVEGGYSLAGANLNIGLLYLSAISSIAVIGIISAGWASNNKYSLLGAMRSAAQLVTYEIPLTLAVLAPVVATGTLNLQQFAVQQDNLGHWLVWPWYTLFAPILFAVSALAELGHVPFDLPEAESELVSGFNTEYSGMKFAMFFLAEFSNSFIMCALFVTLFLGGWQSPFPASVPVLGWDHGVFALAWFFLKTFSCIFVLFWIRATVPRVRIDQLMAIGWKFLIPIGILNIMLVAGLKLVVG